MFWFVKLWKNEAGQSSVLIAFTFVILCFVAAFSVDLGHVAVEKSALQNAADAAVLSGANELPDALAAENTAADYVGLNSGEDTSFSVTYPYNGDPNKIEVVCTKTVDYTFARVLGLTAKEITARAVAEKTGMSGGAFDYTVFSGSSSDALRFNGSDLYIGGSVHTNYQYRMNGSSQTITDCLEAVSSITANSSSISIDTCQAETITIRGSGINVLNMIYSAASFIEMPDFSSVILAQAEDYGEIYTGNTTFCGSYLDVDEPIYVDGDVTINGSNFTGSGVILATGDITFNGSNVTCSSDDIVCFYSANGDITINGSNAELDGLVYAPNGDIRMNGSNQVIHGRVIADTITFNGSNQWIAADENDLDCLPGYTVRLVE